MEMVVNPSFGDFKEDRVVSGEDRANFGVIKISGWGETVVSTDGDDGWEDSNYSHIIGSVPSCVRWGIAVKASETSPFIIWSWKVWSLGGFCASCSDWDS